MSSSKIINLSPKERTPEHYKLYSTTLKTIFENVNYYISKKNPYYQEIYDTTKLNEQNISNDLELNADKYFPILSKSLLVENYKLGKYLFPDLKKLIQNNFLLGETPISKFESEIVPEIKISSGNKIIDLIINSLTNCDTIFEDDDIWLMVYEDIDEIIKNKKMNNNLIGDTFQKVYAFLFRIYLKFEGKKDKQELIFNTLNSFIKNSFNEFNYYMNYSYIEENSSEGKNNDNDIIENIDDTNIMDIYNTLGENNIITNSQLNKIHPIDLLICRTVKSMVDFICIKNSKEFSNKENIVPKNSDDLFKPEFRTLQSCGIKNEYDHTGGFFGWCYICRKTANYYCVQQRIPICSFACKDFLTEEEEQLIKLKDYLIKDCPMILKYFSQILSNKINLADKNKSINERILALKIILLIFDNFGNLINKRIGFIKIVKENLMEGLFKTCLSNNEDIYSLSINLFFQTWKFFRDNLKREINSFIENVFLKILNNDSSTFLAKKVILENISNINYIFFIELYANYDCELNEKFIVKNLINSFNNIYQVRYSKNPLNYTTQEYNILINICLKSISLMVKSIFELCEKEYPNLKHSLNNELNISRVSFSEHVDNNYNYTQMPTETNNEINSNLKKKYELQTAASKFNEKIKIGIEYLKHIGYIDDSSVDKEAKCIMRFFRNTPFLKKQNIGDFLGENTELSLKTLKYFAESFNFKNIDIVQALRLFLSSFQLPVEGQKIDRIIEYFASKYYNDNPNLFSNADSAFYLAYAIMILQTELHNPNIKDRMTTEGFFKLLQSQNNDGTLKKEYLDEIYKQILEEPLSFPEMEEEKDKDKEKNELRKQREKQRLIHEFNYNSKMNQDKGGPFIILKESDIIDYLPQFMSSIINPLLSMFQIIIEESNESTLYNQAITNLVYCIKILGLLNLNQDKEKLISNLCTMTNLLQVKSLTDKNVICIHELLNLANSDFRYCKCSWNLILEIIAKLYYYLSLISMPKEEKEEYYQLKKKNVMESNFKKDITLIEETISAEKEIMKILSKEVNLNDFEKIFLKTLNFDSATLIEFVDSICNITQFEFRNNGLGKIFFLQKIVEISELNLFSRPRFNWNNIWKIISEFFIIVGCSKDNESSANAIDSLRQLAMKFLEREEGENFHFKKDFLMPFFETWKKCNNIYTQEYILICINNIIVNQTKNIKSGWEVMLNIFKEVGKMNNEQNMQKQVIQVMENLSENNYNDIKDEFEDFSQCINLFIPQYQKQMIDIIKNLENQIEEENNFIKILECYKSLIIDNDEQIRSEGLNNIIECLDKKLKNPKSKLFMIGKKEQFWDYIFNRLLIPIAGELISKIHLLSNNNQNLNSSSAKNNDNPNDGGNKYNNFFNNEYNNEEKEKISITLENLLIRIGTLFNDYFFYNYKYLGKYFDELEKIVFDFEEKVQNAGIDCIKFLNGSEKMKNMSFLRPFIIFLTKLADRSLEKDFLTIDINLLKSDKKQYAEIINVNILYCYIHLNILTLLDKLIEQYIDILGEEDLNKILDSLENSLEVSIEFNDRIDLRLTITDIVNSSNVVALFKQLNFSIKNFYLILEHLFNDNNSFQSKQNYYRRIIDSSIKILNKFSQNNREYYQLGSTPIGKNRDEREIKEKENLIQNYVIPLCQNIFPIIQKVLFFKFDKYKEITNTLLEMIICEDEKIRGKVKDLLSAIYTKLTLIK